MTPKGRGYKVTPPRVLELVQKAVAEKSQYAVAKETGLSLSVIQGLLKGNREPSTSTLTKLSNYFNVPLPLLRGDEVIHEIKSGISITKPISTYMIEKQNEDIKEFEEILHEYEVYVQEYLNHLPKEIWNTHGVNLVKYVIRKSEDESITIKDFLWWP